MKTVHITTHPPYDAMIGHGILPQLGEYLRSIFPQGKAVLVCGEFIDERWGNIVADSLSEAGYPLCRIVLSANEEEKSWASLEWLLDTLAEQEITRGDFIIAMGGGVCGDLVGFASAIYLRGLPFVQVPTTLLAAVDASIGGKTGINLERGKNLAGAFHQPSLVFCDCDTLSTLPQEAWADGLAECIKTAAIANKDLFQLLEREDVHLTIEEIIASTAATKNIFVSGDERDLGKRQLLNFGHTWAHALEKRSNYEITHGRAVAIGMVVMARAAQYHGLSREDCTPALISILQKHHLPTESPYTIEDLLPYILNDKKRRGNTLPLILPYEIGNCFAHPLPLTELQHFFSIPLGGNV